MEEASQQNKKFLLIGGIALIFLLLIIFSIFLIQQTTSKPEPESQRTNVNQNSSPTNNQLARTTVKPTRQMKNLAPGLIATAGEENIFAKDLNIEVAKYPFPNEEGIKSKLLSKIIEDSLILQGGRDQNIVTLTPDIFNSADKDYEKRIKTVEAIKNSILKGENKISGSIIAIWFANNGYISPLGYEKSKELAYNKISALREDIITKKITIEQAGEQIKNDPEIAILDLVYKANAIHSFIIQPTDGITFDPAFDADIKSLKPGEITKVTLLKDAGSGYQQNHETVYMVGQVQSIVSNSKVPDYATWLKSLKTQYEITFY